MGMWVKYQNKLLLWQANWYLSTAHKYEKYQPHMQRSKYYAKKEVNEQYAKAADKYYSIGENFDMGNKFEFAIEYYEKAVECYRRAEVHISKLDLLFNDLALAYFNDGQFERSLAACERSIQANSKNDMAFCNKALCLHALGAYDQAVDACQEAIKLERDNGYSHHTLGNVYRAQGKYDEALEAFETSIKIASYKKNYNALSLYSKGSVLVALEKTKKAIEVFVEADTIPIKGRLDRKSQKFVDAMRANPSTRLEAVKDLLQAEKAALRSTLIEALHTEEESTSDDLVQRVTQIQLHLGEMGANIQDNSDSIVKLDVKVDTLEDAVRELDTNFDSLKKALSAMGDQKAEIKLDIEQKIEAMKERFSSQGNKELVQKMNKQLILLTAKFKRSEGQVEDIWRGLVRLEHEIESCDVTDLDIGPQEIVTLGIGGNTTDIFYEM